MITDDASAPLGRFDEAARLDVVRRYDILDTPPDGAFDRITQLAARFCRAPISTISIVDVDRIWFKSAHGIAVEQIGRDPGLCASAVMQLDPYVVTDASIDPRTLDNPLVCGELGLRFYAAVPLTTHSGYNLGTLNVIDVEPREITDEELATLRDLAAVVVDELELRLAARNRVASEAAQEAARLREAIVAGVSHEMRTPLAVLQGTASLLDEPDGLSDEEAASLRAMHRRHLAQLDRLVHQFLDYVSLEGEHPPTVACVPIDLVPIVEEACEIFGDHTIAVRAEAAVPRGLGDPARTKQIVLELVNNATRFSGGTSVEVSVATYDERTVRIAVSDRGRGLHPHDLERVFDKGFRGRHSTGTGLGLYVSKVLAEAQGGRIEVDSEPGIGSTFALLLPTA
ncbi:MAG: GAF domain-containing sensor histidine kinase [Actinobacteria bacterium]|nr:GAF domain-containing sensor histidine kinase [Actinomycetota bacterium]